MAVVTIEELAARLTRGQAIAGLDLGTKTIGISVSDLGRRFATPRDVIRRVKFGLPFNMEGSEGPRAQATRAFVRNMEQRTELPFVYWDERLSTVAAERVLIEMDVSRKKRADRIDSAAASFILQGALDRLVSLEKAASDDTDA
jgi:putative Holliday junction resolvase